MKSTLFIHKILVGTALLFCLISQAQITDPLDDVLSDDNSSLNFEDPFQYQTFYDVESGNYIIYKKIGNVHVGTPIVMTPDEYSEYMLKDNMDDYYKEKANSVETVAREDKEKVKKGLLPSIKVKSKIFETIFGGDKIELIPNGYASFDLGILSQTIDNPQLLPQNRQNFTIDLQQRIQLSLLGKVGENLQLNANYDTQGGFAFENKMNLAWRPPSLNGDSDKIIKNIEFGDINMPLSTSLIQGPQALFGVKTELQFGRTNVTAVFSDQRSEARQITVQGGGLVSTFKLSALDYEANQHYFLGHYFRNNYDNALLNYPFINSNISISRIEVWKIDQGNSNLENQRAVLGLRDLGENTTAVTLPDNANNGLYAQVSALGTGVEEPLTAYETINNQSLVSQDGTNVTYSSGENFAYTTKARLLNSSEYTFNNQLGYISLNGTLPDDQLLAVSFEYTINGSTNTHKVGTFSDEFSQVLKVKLLKPNSTLSTTSPMWDLMMKNIYNLEGSQISRENFFLNVMYNDPGNGSTTYIQNEPSLNNQQLIKTVNWDRLNNNGDSTNGQGDGVFDYVEGLTIQPDKGRIIFTQIEPFGSSLPAGISADKVFNELYEQQKIDAQEATLANRYSIEGRYQGTAGTGISLGAINVPSGSVKVTANGQELIEGSDYVVDYQIGRVQIINQALKDSGAAINISLENQSTFNMQKKRFVGLNLEHKASDKLLLGLTAINYQERPLTQKAQYGYEPVNNTIIGGNLQYNTDAPFLTRFTDGLPLVKTNAPSNISLRAEGAYLIPGQNNAIDNQSYIDDFEETASRISLKDPNAWQLASVPNATDVSPNGLQTDQTSGYGRALMSWYNIDPRFYGVGGSAPGSIGNNSLSQNMVRRIKVEELYSNRDFIAGEALFMNTFDVTMYPNLKGPYNNDTTPIETTDDLITQERWAGVMRSLNVTNFNQANIDNIEFWVMDPYADLSSTGTLGDTPELFLQLGNVSEDILRDGRMLYENGLSSPSQENNITQTPNWGVFPTNFPILYSFESEGDDRRIQDAGYDGILSDNFQNITGFPTETENQKFNNNLGANPINTLLDVQDPALDDFLYYYSDTWEAIPTAAADIRERYRYFRNPEGNSPAASLEAASALPDAEDVNRDYNLDLTENYNQYRISLLRSDLELNTSGYIVDEKEVTSELDNGTTTTNKWYLFRVPLKDANADTSILNNVRYLRLLMKGMDKTTTLRFGSLDLVRTDWRKYSRNIHPEATTNEGENEGIDNSIDISNFDIGAVDIESNGTANPPYMLPPGIVREELGGTSGLQSQNEASLYMKAIDLKTDESRGVYKQMQLDIRRYTEMKLFVHAEDLKNPTSDFYDPEAKFFIRMGSDLSDNYYEYEIPLKYTAQNAGSVFDIWPQENTIELSTQWFVEAKKQRDLASFSTAQRYIAFDTGDPDKVLTVKGRPTLGNITSMMMGVRNTSTNLKSMVVWVNELRLSGIENEGGYAASASLNFNLGDFANISASGNYSSIGFGAIDAGPSLRNQEELTQYAVSTQVNVDKLLPEKWGMKIPVQYTTSETFIDPKYDPLDNDVELDDSPRKEELKKIVRTYTQQKTFAITDLRKQSTGGKKKRFYSVDNLSASMLYSDEFYRDIYTKFNYKQNLRASVDYSYNFKSKYIEPFRKSGFVQDTAKLSDYVVWLKEFNFNPIPTKINFRTEIIRNYNEFQFRDINAIINNTGNSFPTSYTNNFIFGWQYNVGFSLTKNLKLDYNSATRTLVDDIGNNLPDDKLIFEGLTRVGRPINYTQALTANYKLPLNHLPYLDFVDAEVAYTGTYDWAAGSTALDVGTDLGNLAQNGNIKKATANIGFSTLYNKFSGYRKYDSIRIGRKKEIDSLNLVFEKNSEKKKPKKFKKYKFKNKYKLKDYIWATLDMFKQGQIAYTETNSTSLPGFLGQPNFFGVGTVNGNITAPTYGFLFGSQTDLRSRAINQNWLTSSDALYEAYARTVNKTLTASVLLEPMKDLRIDLNFVRNEQSILTQNGYNLNRSAFENETAGFNSSIISFNTAFTNPDEVYSTLLSNAQIVSSRVATQNGAPIIDADSDGYVDGYGLTNSAVLIPAFYSAYTGGNANSTKLGYKRGFPLPNWSISYTGLKNIPFFNHKFNNIELSHAYVSSYSVSGVQSDLDFYNFNQNGSGTGQDLNFNNLNYYSYNSVNMVESFNPLIGVDVTLRNDMQVRAQFNKERLSVLSLSNYTLQEDYSNELIVGVGYILKDLKIAFGFQGKKKKIESDLNMRLDVSLRDNKTTIRRLIEQDLQITGGQNILSIKFSADYNFSDNLNISAFYDQQVSKYKISTAYPLSTTRAGLRATFQLGK